jgi:DNA processing protein
MLTRRFAGSFYQWRVMSDLSHTHYYLGFNLVPGMGPVRLARLVEHCGTIEAAWHATPNDMAAAGVDAKTSAALLQTRRTLNLYDEMERVFAAGVDLLTLEDAGYPALLKQAPNPPPLLYVRSTSGINDDWALAVVGTRSPTTYGKEATRTIVSELAESGLTIVSGLAIGIDSVAHTAALEARGRTIGVLGCGVDIVYPERNRALTERIIEQGAVISEFPLGTKPHPANFPPRNRIISGMTLGTLMVEAGERSGALITVEFALDQGREVFAVPGSIFSQKSKGNHNIIRNGAELVTGAGDILEALNLTTLEVHQEVAAALPEDPTEAALMQHIQAEPQHVDVICRASGMPMAVVSSTLALLELKGFVRHVGNMEYVRR